MAADEGIIKPVKGKNSPSLGPVAAIAAIDNDLHGICILMDISIRKFNNLIMSRLYMSQDNSFSLAGPVLGAPYAVMVLENLIAWGVRKIIYYGICGSVSPDVHIGDIVVPDSALVDEGTSSHYDNNQGIVLPSENMMKATREILIEQGFPFHKGKIWTTDAVYRETKDKVKENQNKDVIAVDMETSALFSLAKYRNVDICAIHVVSDELGTYEWKSGFGNKRFKKSRRNVRKVVSDICKSL